jgi:hypothetical protein
MASFCGVAGTVRGTLFDFCNEEAQSWGTAANHANLQFHDSVLMSADVSVRE